MWRIRNGLSSPGIKESKLWALHMLESSGQLPFLQAIINSDNYEEISIPHSLLLYRKGCSPPPSLCRSTFAFLSQNICQRGLNVLRWGLKTCLCMIHYITTRVILNRLMQMIWTTVINAKVRDSQIAPLSNLTSKTYPYVLWDCRY